MELVWLEFTGQFCAMQQAWGHEKILGSQKRSTNKQQTSPDAGDRTLYTHTHTQFHWLHIPSRRARVCQSHTLTHIQTEFPSFSTGEWGSWVPFILVAEGLSARVQWTRCAASRFLSAFCPSAKSAFSLIFLGLCALKCLWPAELWHSPQNQDHQFIWQEKGNKTWTQYRLAEFLGIPRMTQV